MYTSISMVILSSIFLTEACWSLKRESMTLTDYHGTELIAELSELNEIIRDRIEPSKPYSVDLEAVRDELA